MLTPPVLFLVFNRPEKTRQVLQAIRTAQPARLYVAADGPRAGRPEEAARCKEVRQLIDEGIDWPCQLHTLYREANLGCKLAVREGISWFFEQEEAGIILEDDVLPVPGFFSYCAEGLQRYAEVPRVMHIGGYNFGIGHSSFSCYFSQNVHVWGWASWRRAWQCYDGDMVSWPAFRDAVDLEAYFRHAHEGQHRRHIWERCYQGTIDTWDYQWSYSVVKEGGLALVPSVPLISNIGHDAEGTHTQQAEALPQAPPQACIDLGQAPPFVLPDFSLDALYYQRRIQPSPPRWRRMLQALRKALG